jgi:hypothetical protein
MEAQFRNSIKTTLKSNENLLCPVLPKFDVLYGIYQRFSNCGASPPGGDLGPRGRGARDVCMKEIFILNEICAQDKICILVGTLLG